MNIRCENNSKMVIITSGYFFFLQGVPSNAVFTILSSIPEVEKFAKFWICKAKLLASKGSFDVIGLYEEAIRNGATVSICLGWVTSGKFSHVSCLLFAVWQSYNVIINF